MIALIIAMILVSCTEITPLPPSTPSSTGVMSETPTSTLPATATETATPTRSLTPTMTPEGPVTPTQEGPEALTLTPGATPLPVLPGEGAKVEDAQGWYTPRVRLNVRSCVAVVAECYTGEMLEPGVAVYFYARVTFYPSGDIWLCLDPALDASGLLTSDCHRDVVYQFAGVTYGVITWP